MSLTVGDLALTVGDHFLTVGDLALTVGDQPVVASGRHRGNFPGTVWRRKEETIHLTRLMTPEGSADTTSEYCI